MEKKKKFIVSGDSFTYSLGEFTWPYELNKELNLELINVAMPSQGNGLIAKKLIHQLNNELKSVPPEDILVGVMWTVFERTEFYVSDRNKIPTKNIDGWLENPTGIVNGVENKKWFICNAHWSSPISQLWYKNLHNDIQCVVDSLYTILSVQWFLEVHKIDYFMSSITDPFKCYDHLKKHPEIEYWYNMIDFNKFLPIKGCHEWVIEHCGEAGIQDPHGIDPFHPNGYGYEKFTKDVIFPYLKERKLI